MATDGFVIHHGGVKTALFSIKKYDREFLEIANADRHSLHFLEPHLTRETTALARDFEAVCIFVNDVANRDVLELLAAGGVRFIALRCAGFNHVDLATASRLNLTVARVPAYSPYAVAEHTVGLMLALNRKLHRAYNRVREGNFSLEGLLGFDMRGKTVGLVGTGQIGAVTARIAAGFGCRVLAYDIRENPSCLADGVHYVGLEQLFMESDIISLHCPLTPENHHMINATSLATMKEGVMLINTSRGGLIDTQAAVEGLKSGRIGYLGLDVYEEEGELFFEDLSDTILHDDVFTRLLTFPNVLITGHQAFFTRNALARIAETTIGNLTEFEESGRCANAVRA